MPTVKTRNIGDPLDHSTWRPRTPRRGAGVYLGDPADDRPHTHGLSKGGVLVGKFRSEDEAWDYLADAERRGLTRRADWWGAGVDPSADVVVDRLSAMKEHVKMKNADDNRRAARGLRSIVAGEVRRALREAADQEEAVRVASAAAEMTQAEAQRWLDDLTPEDAAALLDAVEQAGGEKVLAAAVKGVEAAAVSESLFREALSDYGLDADYGGRVWTAVPALASVAAAFSTANFDEVVNPVPLLAAAAIFGVGALMDALNNEAREEDAARLAAARSGKKSG